MIQKRSKKEIKNNFNSHTIIIVRASLILTLAVMFMVRDEDGYTEIDREREREGEKEREQGGGKREKGCE